MVSVSPDVDREGSSGAGVSSVVVETPHVKAVAVLPPTSRVGRCSYLSQTTVSRAFREASRTAPFVAEESRAMATGLDV
jgi:hypothetical protein